MKHPIGHTQNGMSVYVDLIYSQAATHLAQQPYLLGLVKEALRRLIVDGPKYSIEYDMGRTIGYDFVVKTSETDIVLYAQLIKDDTYTRFVKHGKPLSTQYLTIILHQDKQNEHEYELHDIWVGHMHPPRPGSANETAKSISYWSNHAFVLDSQSLQSRTITKTCPY
jgi:hypothetical protein